MLAAIFWFIGFYVFVYSAIHLPDKFQRPGNQWERMVREEPGIIFYLGRIYWWSGVCIFWFLGSLIHPAIFWIFWFIGFWIFIEEIDSLPRKFRRPANYYGGPPARGKPEIMSWFQRIFGWTGVCIFLFLGTLAGIHPAIFCLIGAFMLLFLYSEVLNESKLRKEKKKQEEDSLQRALAGAKAAQRKEKLDAFTKGCTKRKILFGFIGMIIYSTAGGMKRARENPTHWGWYFQDSRRPSSYECTALLNHEGLIPTEMQLKMAEEKRNRKLRRGISASSRVQLTVKELQKAQQKYDAINRRKS